MLIYLRNIVFDYVMRCWPDLIPQLPSIQHNQWVITCPENLPRYLFDWLTGGPLSYRNLLWTLQVWNPEDNSSGDVIYVDFPGHRLIKSVSFFVGDEERDHLEQCIGGCGQLVSMFESYKYECHSCWLKSRGIDWDTFFLSSNRKNTDSRYITQ